MNTTTYDSGEAEYVEVWNDVGSNSNKLSIINSVHDSALSDHCRAVLWILVAPDVDDGGSKDHCPIAAAAVAADGSAGCASRLLAHGAAEVALIPPKSTIGGIAGGDGSCDCQRKWLPSDVRVISHPTLRARRPPAAVSSSIDNHASIINDTDTTGREALISPCLAEALGLPSAPETPPSALVKLRVRALRCHGPATVVELQGPYPLPLADLSSQEADRSGDYTDSSERPPASVVAAVTSILPCALEGEVVAEGSVLRVAGLFSVVVTAVWTTGERKDQDGLPQPTEQEERQKERAETMVPHVPLLSTTGAARIQDTTELRLVALPPRGKNFQGVQAGTSAHATCATAPEYLNPGKINMVGSCVRLIRSCTSPHSF